MSEPIYKNVKDFYTPIDRVYYEVTCKCGYRDEWNRVPNFCPQCGKSWKADKKAWLAYMKKIDWGWKKRGDKNEN